MKKLIFILLLILCFKEISAIGIVTKPGDTLELMEGTSTTYEILLQNTEDEIEVRLVLGSEIAKIIDYKEVYVLPAGVSNTPVIFNITAPKNAKVGDEYAIGYYIEPTSGKGGAISFGVRINKQLKVKIIENPNKFHIGDYLYKIIIVSVILILLLIISYVKKHKKSKRKKF